MDTQNNEQTETRSKLISSRIDRDMHLPKTLGISRAAWAAKAIISASSASLITVPNSTFSSSLA